MEDRVWSKVVQLAQLAQFLFQPGNCDPLQPEAFTPDEGEVVVSFKLTWDSDDEDFEEA